MVLYVLDALTEVDIERAVVVVGHGAERVTKKLQEHLPAHLNVDFVEQRMLRGTGDAVLAALTVFPEDDLDQGDVLVLPGDTPLLAASTVAMLVREHQLSDAACTVLTAALDDPTGYGRVIRAKDGRLARIVDDSDVESDAHRAIQEVNTSVYCFRRSVLAPALRRISPENARGEHYLTDIVQVLYDAGYPVLGVPIADVSQVQGVNDRTQLAAAEAELRRRTNSRWLSAGITMLDPDHTYVDATVQLASDVTLFPGTMLAGATTIGKGAEIGPNTRLVDCVVGPGAAVEETVGRYADIGEGAWVGPFAALEPGSHVPAGLRTGPFYTALGEESSI